MTKPVLIRRSERPAPLNVIGESVTVLKRGDASSGYEVFLQQGPPEIGPPPHHHPWAEAFYMISGRMKVLLDAETHVVEAGDFVVIPPNTTHAFTNLTDCTMLSMNSAEGAASFFEQVSSELGMPPEIPKLAAIGGAHGIDLGSVS